MLPIFPEQVLDNSLHTAILVGLVITWGMFELFGWVFAGFVVSGYLAALAMISPQSLLVVLAESVLCYGLVWIVATGLSMAGLYSRVFGRERFLLFVLASIPVRLLVTGAAMPRLEAHLLARGWELEQLGFGLFGVGIVLVPLTANTFYKLGLSRGLVQLGVNATLTWVVVAQVIARFTNFGFGDFAHTFDAMALAVTESSRVVLVLVCTIFVAAHNNLRFGWDFGGILVPALLAMLVFTPDKLVATIGEIVVLYAVYRAVLRLPGVATLDLEGPRRIVSIYATAWAVKFAIAWIVGALDLPIPVQDVYGFGYLLTSLVVSRCAKQGGVVRTLTPLLATSAMGVATALPIAAGLALLPHDAVLDDRLPTLPPAIARAVPALGAEVHASVAGREPPWESQVGRSPLDAPPADAPAVLGQDGRVCRVDPAGRLAPLAGRPLVVACGGDGPVLLLPTPLDDPDATWIAGWLASRADVSGVILASVDPSRHPTQHPRALDALARTVTAARHLAGHRPLIVVRTGGTRAPHLHLRDSTTVSGVVPALGLPDLKLDTGPLPDGTAALWPMLRSRDGILALSRERVEALATLPVEPWPDGLPDVVVPALRRALVDPATTPGAVPAWLTHLAALVDARVTALPDGTWSVEASLSSASRAPREQLVLRPGGAPWVVVASQAWRWPGLVDIAAHSSRTLNARVTWVRDTPPSERDRSRPLGTGRPDPVDRLVRALLAPDRDWRQSGLVEPDGHVLLIEAAPVDTGPVRVSAGDEGTSRLPPLDAPPLDALLAPWPGARLVTPGSSEASWQPSNATAVGYQQAIAPSGIVLVWLPGDRLREAAHASERDARVAWFVAHGVPATRTAPTAPPTAPDAALCRAADALADHPTELSLAALDARTKDLRVVPDDLRIAVWADGCTGLAGRIEPGAAP